MVRSSRQRRPNLRSNPTRSPRLAVAPWEVGVAVWAPAMPAQAKTAATHSNPMTILVRMGHPLSLGRQGVGDGAFPIALGTGFPGFDGKILGFRTLRSLDAFKAAGPFEDFAGPSARCPSHRPLTLDRNGRPVGKVDGHVLHEGACPFDQIICIDVLHRRHFSGVEHVERAPHPEPHCVPLHVGDRGTLTLNHPGVKLVVQGLCRSRQGRPKYPGRHHTDADENPQGLWCCHGRVLLCARAETPYHAVPTHTATPHAPNGQYGGRRKRRGLSGVTVRAAGVGCLPSGLRPREATVRDFEVCPVHWEPQHGPRTAARGCALKSKIFVLVVRHG